jgi:NAD-dependent deacetylase
MTEATQAISQAHLEARRSFIDELRAQKKLLIVTGAGISVASGIRPFRRSEDAHWERDVTELATNSYFQRSPEGSWAWYLERFAGLSDVKPNPAHHAIKELGELLAEQGGSLSLITQNIDCLHRAAGSEAYEVHGRSDMLRCVNVARCEHAAPRGLIPRESVSFEAFDLSRKADELPRCESCGSLLRPHVLWFDESYSEHEAYQIEEAIEAASEAELVLFIGTSFSVGITYFIEQLASQNGVKMWAIDPSPVEDESPPVSWLREPSEQVMPALVELLREG